MVTFVSDERDLGVEDEVTAFGQENEDVGLVTLAIGVGETRLEAEFATLAQPGAFEEALQYQLAPITRSLVVAFEGLGEVVGFLGEALVEAGEVFQLGEEDAVLFGTLFAHLVQFAQFLAQGLEELVELLAVLAGEFRALVVENVLGESLELVGELLISLGDPGFLFAQGGLELGNLGFGTDAGLAFGGEGILDLGAARLTFLVALSQGVAFSPQAGGPAVVN